MPASYWIVNLSTKEYHPVVDEGNFFDGDWKQNTPWPDEKYVNLSAQKIHSDQVFQKDAFYGYDLAPGGMIVGVYYDASIKLKDMHAYVKRLRRDHDVVSVYYHRLVLCDKPKDGRSQDAPGLEKLKVLQQTIGIVQDSSVGFFDKWDIPVSLRAAIYNYQLMKARLNEELEKYGIEEL